MKQEIKTFLQFTWLVTDDELADYEIEPIDQYWLDRWDGNLDVIRNARLGDYWIEGQFEQAIVRIEHGNAIEIWSNL